jgi:hypothetical protein
LVLLAFELTKAIFVAPAMLALVSIGPMMRAMFLSILIARPYKNVASE